MPARRADQPDCRGVRSERLPACPGAGDGGGWDQAHRDISRGLSLGATPRAHDQQRAPSTRGERPPTRSDSPSQEDDQEHDEDKDEYSATDVHGRLRSIKCPLDQGTRCSVKRVTPCERFETKTSRWPDAAARSGALRPANHLPAAGNDQLVHSDAEVIVASLGCPDLFGTIFDRHATALHRYLVRRVGVDTADPLLGELFRVAFERRDTFDSARPDARPWLYGIASRLLAHHYRGEARRLRAMARLARTDVPLHQAEDDAAAARLSAEQRWPLVAQAVARLPDGERDALLLYAWEELTYDQIAIALDVPVGTVRSRLNRARRRLRELPVLSGRDDDE
jgi:RNA polymerase sigma factor (sigma-70 family)